MSYNQEGSLGQIGPQRFVEDSSIGKSALAAYVFLVRTLNWTFSRPPRKLQLACFYSVNKLETK